MSRTDPTGTPYRRRAADRRSSTSRVATVGGLLILVLLVLYYVVAATLEIRELRAQLDREHDAAVLSSAAAALERQETLDRLTLLQADLDTARAEVASLREQLIQAGITPVTVGTAPAGDSQLDRPDAQEATGAPETAPDTQVPPAAPPVAPGPPPAVPAAPPAIDPPAEPAPEEPRGLLRGENHLACILTICL